jgi:hypothetical protein
MIVVSRREFARILEILSARGLLSKAGPALSIFEIIGEPRPALGATQSTPPRGAINAIQDTISSYVQNVTRGINNATTAISQTSYTPSVGAGVHYEIGGVSFSASGGIFVSFNFHTGDYVLPTPYTTVAIGG